MWPENHDYVVNHDDTRSPGLSPQDLCESFRILPISPSLRALPSLHKNSSSQSSDRYVLPIRCSPSLKLTKLEYGNAGNKNSASQDLGSFAGSAVYIQELEDDLASCGMAINDHSRNLEILNSRRLHVQRDVSDLQGLIFCFNL